MDERISRVDLHVHSHFSKTADDWLLQTLGANECYTTPQQAYRLAKARGMNFVTLTDHDCIDGAQELTQYQDFFISEEITTQFPEDGVRLHVVALDIDEEKHRIIQSLRSNVYELVGYLNAKRIVHFVAHPFFRMSEVLTLDHFEKMLLLFNIFEVKNGGKQLWPDDLLVNLLDQLAPEQIWRLANKHDMQPVGETPWLKGKVAGSDDHGGILIGHPHTVCPEAVSVAELINDIRDGASRAEGLGGSVYSVAHQILAVAYRHLKTRKESFDPFGSEIAWNLLGQLFDAGNLEQSLSLSSKLALFLNQSKGSSRSTKANGSPGGGLRKQISRLTREDDDLRRFLQEGLNFDPINNERLFAIVSKTINRMIAEAFSKSEAADLFSLLKRLKELLAAAPLLAPYLIAFRTEHRDKPLMREAVKKIGYSSNGHAGERIAVFADDSAKRMTNNGILSYFLKPELEQEAEIHVFGLSSEEYCPGRHRNFLPVTTLHLPKQGLPPLHLPPILDVARALAEGDFDKIYLHTIGPMAVLGALLGWLMRIPVYARFHLQGIHYQMSASGDHNRHKAIRLLLHRYFSHMAEVRVMTETARKMAIAMGIPSERIRVLNNVAGMEQKIAKMTIVDESYGFSEETFIAEELEGALV